MTVKQFKSLIALTIVLIGVTGTASAEWNIDQINGLTTGNESKKYLVTNLTTSTGEPVNASQLEGEFTYKYNKTGGEKRSMEHLYSGYWYAEINPNTTRGSKVLYEAAGETTSPVIEDNTGDKENLTVELDVGKLTINTTNTFDRLYSAGDETLFEAYATRQDENTNITGDSNSIGITFEDFKTETQFSYSLDEFDEGDELYFDSRVDIPLVYGRNMLLEYKTNEGGETGVTSRFIETSPRLDGSLQPVEAQRCSSDTSPSACQPGSNLTLTYDTDIEADKVNFSIRAGRQEKVLKHEAPERRNGVYNTSFIIPDFNTTKVDGTNMTVRVNATENKQIDVQESEIELNPFEVANSGTVRTTSGSYNAQLSIKRPYSPDPLTPDNVSGKVDIRLPNGSITEGLSIQEFSFNSETGIYQNQFSLPGKTGEHKIDFNISNRYGIEREGNFSFDTFEPEATYDLNAPEYILNKTGNVKYQFEAENLVGTETNISFNTTGTNLTINNGENVTLNGSETRKVNFTYSASDSLESEEFEINTTEESSSFFTAEDFEFSRTALCDQRQDSICSFTNLQDIDVDQTTNNSLNVLYTGDFNSTRQYQVSVTGNISEIATVTNNTVTFNGLYSNDTAEINYTIEPEVPGFYEGSLDIGQKSISLRATSNVPEPSTRIELSPESADIGSVTSGDDGTTEIDITNTGEATITELTADSTSKEVSTQSLQIEPGETQTVELTVADITSTGSSTVDITASSEFGESTQQVAVAYRSETTTSPSPSPSEPSPETPSPGSPAETTDPSDSVETTTPDEDSGGLPILPIAAGLFVFLLVGFVLASSIELEPGDPLYDVFHQ